MEQQTILAALVGILVLVSAFQALQLAELSGRVSVMGSGIMQNYAPSGAQQPSGNGAQQVQLPSGISNAPDMVGGC